MASAPSCSAEAISLRPATVADAAVAASLLLRSRQAFLPYLPVCHPLHEVQDWLATQLIPRGGVTVAEADGQLLGLLATACDDGVAWIEQLYLLPGHTGRGLGGRLLRKAMAELPRPLRLYCFQANRAACAFYERHRFRAMAFGDGSGNEESCPDVLYELAA